jgi:alkylation response protein AidB-like acyl-CoA dehydrogenase
MSGINERWIARAEEVARAVLARHADAVDREGRWPAESVGALAESGLLGLTIPSAIGGGGEGPRTFARVTQAIAAHCASTAMIYLMHVCAAQMILAAREFSEREAVLRAIVAGRHLSTLSISERGSRSHFWAAMSQAAVDGSAHVLSAEKSWVTSAGHADGYIVSTRGVGRTDPTATTLYYVPREAAGLSVGGPWNGLGLRGNASSPMCLKQVRIPASFRLCPEGEGFQAMMANVLPLFQIGSAAVSTGIAEAAATATRQHLVAAKLEHLGQALASLPTLRARLAEMQIGVDMQRAFLDHVAEHLENPGSETLRLVLESKAAAAETALEVTDLAMRACGGTAFSRHLSVERNFRDARAAAVMAPTTDVLHDLVGRTLLDLPLF